MSKWEKFQNNQEPTSRSTGAFFTKEHDVLSETDLDTASNQAKRAIEQLSKSMDRFPKAEVTELNKLIKNSLLTKIAQGLVQTDKDEYSEQPAPGSTTPAA